MQQDLRDIRESSTLPPKQHALASPSLGDDSDEKASVTSLETRDEPSGLYMRAIQAFVVALFLAGMISAFYYAIDSGMFLLSIFACILTLERQ